MPTPSPTWRGVVRRLAGAGALALVSLPLLTLQPPVWARPVPRAERIEAARIASTLARLPIYPGASPAPAAGFPIDGPQAVPGSPDLVSVDRLWYAQATPAGFAAWLDAHAPARLTSVGSFGGNVGATGVMLAPNPDPARITVEISWQSAASGRLAVRYDVLGIWQPPHPPAEVLPADVTARVSLRVSARAPLRSFTLDRPAAHRLAALVNALPVDTRGVVHGCPAEFAGPATHVTVRFLWPGGSLTVREGADSCAGVVVATGAGSPLPGLFDPGERILAAAEGMDR